MDCPSGPERMLRWGLIVVHLRDRAKKKIIESCFASANAVAQHSLVKNKHEDANWRRTISSAHQEILWTLKHLGAKLCSCWH